MTFKLTKASDYNKPAELIEIKSIEDLAGLQLKYFDPSDDSGYYWHFSPLIVDFINNEITIYDDFIE